MSQSNAIEAFWSQSIGLRRSVTPEEIDTIRRRFAVVGELREVKKAPGYVVSSDGRVFSCLPCSWTKERPRECKPIRTTYGYRMIRLQVNKKPSAECVHRLVAMEFLPEPAPEQTVVRHLDGDPSNNNLANLAWGTQADNMQDAVRHGRTLKGLKNPNARLTPGIVSAVRILVAEGYSANAIASFLGVDGESVRRAVTGEHWGHVQ